MVGHDCEKSLLAFRKPAVAAASRRPARTDAPKVGLDGPPSLAAPGELRGALRLEGRGSDSSQDF